MNARGDVVCSGAAAMALAGAFAVSGAAYAEVADFTETRSMRLKAAFMLRLFWTDASLTCCCWNFSQSMVRAP